MTRTYQFLKELVLRFLDDQAFGLAAQLAYFFLLSLFPFMIFLVTLIGYIPVSHENLIRFFAEFAPGDAMEVIESNVLDIVKTQNGKLLSISVLGTVWSASNAINALMRALNRAYHVEENRPFLIARGLSIVFTFLMMLVIVVALALPVFGEKLGLMIFSYFGLSEAFLRVWGIVRWGLSFLILYVVFAGIYYFTPNKRLTAKEVIPGTIVATTGWLLVSLGFSYYVSNFGNYSATYGSLGGIIVLMIWFYLSGIIIIFGGEINAVLKQFRTEKL